MAPRKKAGPRIGQPIAVTLSEKDWRKFVIAITPDVAVADETTLEHGRTLRRGLESAVELLLSGLSGPTVREAKAELRDFVANVISRYQAISPALREGFSAEAPELPSLCELGVMQVHAWLELLEKETPTSDAYGSDAFLTNIIWLVKHCKNAKQSLPSKENYQGATDYPIYRSARAAVEIAYRYAQQYVPEAAPALRRIHASTPSTFVSRLLRARRGVPMLPFLLK
jgi:hypothetical protein